MSKEEAIVIGDRSRLKLEKEKNSRGNRTPGWEILTPRDIVLGSVRLGEHGKGGQARREGSRGRWNTRDSEGRLGRPRGLDQ